MCHCTMSDFDATCKPGHDLYGQAAIMLVTSDKPDQLFTADDAIRWYRDHCYTENPRLVFEANQGR